MSKDQVIDEIQEAEIVTFDNSPKAVMQTPKQLRGQMERDKQIRAIIDEYIKHNMVSGKDYGTINIRGHESKPSLFKPGAEKFCGLFKIRPTFKRDSETVDMLGNTPGILAYICELVDSQGRVVGEGRGTAKTDPINGGDFDINKQVKIAQKRAQIDAVLRTGGLSDFFTQDMEDAPKDVKTPQAAAKRRYATPKQIELLVNKVKWGLKEYDKDELLNWLDNVLGKPLNHVMIDEVDDSIQKIDEALREEKVVAEVNKGEKPGDVVVDITDEQIKNGISLEDLPY